MSKLYKSGVFTVIMLLYSAASAFAGIKPMVKSSEEVFQVVPICSNQVTLEYTVTPGSSVSDSLSIGEEVEIIVKITNNTVDPISRIRVDFYDNNAWDQYNSTNIILGRHLIMKSAVFSHGNFYKTNWNGIQKSAPDSGPSRDSQQAVLDDGDTSYSWIIDDLFRNGELAAGETATLTIRAVVAWPYTGYAQSSNELAMHFNWEGGYCSTILYESIYIEEEFPAGESEMHIEAFAVAPEGLQAGEPFFFQINLYNYTGYEQYVDINALVTKGLVDNYNSVFRWEYHPPFNYSAPVEISELLSTVISPIQQEWKQVSQDQTQSYEDGICTAYNADGTIELSNSLDCLEYPGEYIVISPGVASIWLQGIAGVEANGETISLNGSFSLLAGKAASGANTNALNASSFSASVDVADMSFIKAADAECVNPGDTVRYQISVTGVDLKKLNSVVLLSDILPDGLTLVDVETNFPLMLDSHCGPAWETALYNSGDLNGMVYQWSNQSVGKLACKSTIDEANNMTPYTYDYHYFDWYEAYTFTLTAVADTELGPGVLSNTANLEFYTYQYDVEVYPPKTAVVLEGFTWVEPSEIEWLMSNFAEMGSEDSKFMVSASLDITAGCQTFTLAGYKFEDMNANGVFDNGEPTVANWPIILQSSTGTDTTYTDSHGYYEFAGLFEGNYSIREASQQGWNQSLPAGEGFYQFLMNKHNLQQRADFGNYRYASVSGVKYHDLDGSGTRDDGEPGMADVQMQLVNGDGSIAATTLTDSNGYYLFGEIVPGHYSVREVLTPGYQQSQPGPAGGGFYHLVLTSGQEMGPRNFGNYVPAVLSGQVFFDLGGPMKTLTTGGVLSDLMVVAIRRGPARDLSKTVAEEPLSAQVGDDGHFTFGELMPGEYEASVVLPDFWRSTTPNPVVADVPSGEHALANFGVLYDELAAPETTTGSITGSIFDDTGLSNGVFPTNPAGAGISVVLNGLSSRGTEISRTVNADAQGRYRFTDLPAGLYRVSFVEAAGASSSWPFNAQHAVELGEDEHIGRWPSGEAGGAGWLADAIAGMDHTFGALTLALDTNLDGVADSRMHLSGTARLELTGQTGQTSRGLVLHQLMMKGFNAEGGVIQANTPALISSDGTIFGAGAFADIDVTSGLLVSLDGQLVYSDQPLTFVGQADRWPVRNTGWQHNVAAGADPIGLRVPNGTLMANVIFAEFTPLHGVDFGAENVDFGDAPDTFGTLRANISSPFVITSAGMTFPTDGARHRMVLGGKPAPTLGAAVTADVNGKPSADADADSDDGVELPDAVAPGGTLSMEVSVTGTGLLSVWADWNQDGNFAAGEKVVSEQSLTTGQHTITAQVPATAAKGKVAMRFRLTTQMGVGPRGVAVDGEVEDYMLMVDAALAGGGGGLPTTDPGLGSDRPTEFALGKNYPNPFNPTTVIPYDLAGDGRVRLAVYDITGRVVANLVDAVQNAGRHQVTFDAKSLPSGMYMVRLEAGGRVMTSKLTLLK